MKVYLRTFGCRANHYDTEAVREMVVAAGHSVVASAAEADAAVFNSCAVTADAEADLRQAIRRAAREQPSLRTVVMGCASALDADRAPALSIRALPTVEQLVAGADLPAIAAALELEYDIKPLPNGDAPMLRTRVQTGARALLRVQDGCDEHCTFCATTIARGPNRSRGEAELVREAAALAERHSEIVITGIHIGTYGADIGSSLGVVARSTRPRRSGRSVSPVIDRGDGDRRPLGRIVDRRAGPRCAARPRASSVGLGSCAAPHGATLVHGGAVRRGDRATCITNEYSRIGCGRHRGIPGRNERATTPRRVRSSRDCRLRTCTCFRSRCDRAPEQSASVRRSRRH